MTYSPLLARPATPFTPPTAGACCAAAPALMDERAAARWRLVARAAALCAERGHRRIALYGAGRHTRTYIRQPWSWHGVRVVAVLDDEPMVERIGGVRVVRPGAVTAPVDAVVVSSDCYEREIYGRARAVFGPLGIPVVRIYGDEPEWEEDAVVVRRLIETCGVPEADARWLVANRSERHDATLPMLIPARTEMHLRRYELAASYARGRRVIDAACGTGYGAAFLVDQAGATGVVGVDVDPGAVRYAARVHCRPGVSFRCAAAERTGEADGSAGLVTSFETIEHVDEPRALLAEFARVLSPGGRLVISTPNDRGLTEFHAHSLTPGAFRGLLEERFRIEGWLGQRAGDAPATDGLPAGMFALEDDRWQAETLLAVATVR